MAVGSRLAKIDSYRDLRVWREAMDAAEAVYRASVRAPADWKYALGSQTLRAAASVPANIAEGYGRDSTGSYTQFLKFARGSLKELESHLILAQRVGAFPNGEADKLLMKLEGVGKMLNALIRAVRSSRNPETEAGTTAEA